ncbi:unnamed protein product [Mycena citricolor]|uniref:Argonaute-like protein n=1 Tax=Mycena citricolor TaxID=2018698 RepID=A0AAD2HAD8_9AGAR|nr:unnamed protein product [Mycena citricolor]
MQPSGRGRGARGGGSRGGRGGPRGGGAAPGPSAPFQAPAAHITTVGARRPDYGKSGRPINIATNLFKVDIPEGSIHHYDVVIAGDKVLPRSFNMEIIRTLQNSTAPTVFAETRAVFDGQKNMFTPVPLNFGGAAASREFDVALEGAGSPGRPPKIIKVRIAHVATINTEVLHRYIQGKQSADNTVSTALTALNVAIRMEPSQRYPTKGRSFFTDKNTRPLGGGLEMWRGYFQSIRPVVGRMVINVDISTGVMYKPGPLIGLCLEFLDQPRSNPAQLLTSRGLDDRTRLRLGRFLAGVRVETKDAGSNARRARVIRKLSQKGANELTFQMRDGQTKTVAQYFYEVSRQRLANPQMLCVEIGQGALIPLELCTVIPGQQMRKELPETMRKSLVEFSSPQPMDRLNAIRQGFQVLAYGQSEYVRKFGLTVAPSESTVQARVLKPPVLQYGPGSKQKNVEPRNGAWNMMEKKLYRPTSIGPWVLVSCDSRVGGAALDAIAEGFVGGCESTGIKMQHKKPWQQMVNPQGDIPQLLREAGKKCFDQFKAPPTLFVVILPDFGNDIYTTVKHWGDVLQGIPTQCLKSSKCRYAKIQYWANVALKINVKMDGINVIPDPAASAFLSDPRNPTAVIGFDVMHPAPGSTDRPSFTAAVSSVDSNAAKYVAVQGVQESRKELIDGLDRMVTELLEKYMLYRERVEKVAPQSKAPKRLIVYRDGVSEGQFQQVLDVELPQIKAGCAALGIKPSITLVVVGKRHHVRLFPTNDRDADRSGNLPAGTVLDQELVNPVEFDFFLLSHAGLLGTSRPAHYSVLYDENKLNADTMQMISFALCHVYAKSTRSVSIPAPVYYADTVCARAKIHYDPSKVRDESAYTNTTDASKMLETLKADFRPLHSNQKFKMFFS